jgi:hypothetical protein
MAYMVVHLTRSLPWKRKHVATQVPSCFTVVPATLYSHEGNDDLQSLELRFQENVPIILEWLFVP